MHCRQTHDCVRKRLRTLTDKLHIKDNLIKTNSSLSLFLGEMTRNVTEHCVLQYKNQTQKRNILITAESPSIERAFIKI